MTIVSNIEYILVPPGLWLARISALLFVAVLVWLYFEKRKIEKA
ncbi:MAG: hypothetical protein AABW54_02185 [Candidatus Micrarchaeota archaeon]